MKVKRIIFVLVVLLLFTFNSRGLCNANQDQNVNVHTIDQLSQALLENNIELVEKIIDSGLVDINQKDSNGRYPLEMVLVMGNCDMARILLEAGADPFVITSEGVSIYEKVVSEGSEYLKEIFKDSINEKHD